MPAKRELSMRQLRRRKIETDGVKLNGVWIDMPLEGQQCPTKRPAVRKHEIGDAVGNDYRGMWWRGFRPSNSVQTVTVEVKREGPKQYSSGEANGAICLQNERV